MVDLFKTPRHGVKVIAECDEDQAAFASLCAKLARDGEIEGDADELEAKAAMYAADAEAWHEAAPDFPRAGE